MKKNLTNPAHDITKNLITGLKYTVLTITPEEFDKIEPNIIKALKNVGATQSTEATERKRNLCGQVFRIKREIINVPPSGKGKAVNVIDGTNSFLPGYLVKEVLDDDIAKEKYPELFL